MKLIYTPADGEPQEWPIDANDLTVGEVRLAEKYTDLTLGEIGDQIERGSFTVLIVLLWLFRKRNEPSLKLGDLDDIRLSEIKTEGDEDPAALDDAEGEGPKDGTAPPAA